MNTIRTILRRVGADADGGCDAGKHAQGQHRHYVTKEKFFALTCTSTAGNRASHESWRSRSTVLGAKISPAPPRKARTRKIQNSTLHFTLRSNRFSLREFPA